MSSSSSSSGVTHKLDAIPDVKGDVLPEYLNGDFKLSMWVPADMAGKIIGKKGTVISNIQRETKAKVINALPAVGNSLWIAIAIIGDWASIVGAYNALNDIVQGEVDDVVLEFTINYRKKFFLYGRNIFPTVNAISARTNVRIFFPDFNPKEQSYSEIEPITMEGSFASVLKAVALFEYEALQYVEQMKERAASLEMREKRDKEFKDRRGEKDGKDREKLVDTRLKVAPTVVLDRKTKTASGPPAEAKPTAVAVEKKAAASDVRKVDSAATTTTSKVLAKTVDTKKDATKPTAATTTVSELPTPAPLASVVKETAAAASKTSPPIAPTLSSIPTPKPTATAPALSTTQTATTTQQTTAIAKASTAKAAKESVMESGDKATEKTEKPESVKVTRPINIPFNIVGLLLSKKPNIKISIMNQIQSNTRTFISKVTDTPAAAGVTATSAPVPPTKASKISNTRRRRQNDDDPTASSADEASDSDSDEEDSSDESGDGEVVGASKEEGKAGAASADQGPVVFNIVGYSTENVDAAYGFLERIIKGERIKEVLDSMPRRPREPRPERPERPARPERPERPARPERPERPARPERPERPARPDRAERSERPERSERNADRDAKKRDGKVPSTGVVKEATTVAGDDASKVRKDEPDKTTERPPKGDVRGKVARSTGPASAASTATPSMSTTAPAIAPTIGGVPVVAVASEKGPETDKEKRVENSRAGGLRNASNGAEEDEKEKGRPAGASGGRGGGRDGGRGRGNGRGGRGGAGRGASEGGRGEAAAEKGDSEKRSEGGRGSGRGGRGEGGGRNSSGRGRGTPPARGPPSVPV